MFGHIQLRCEAQVTELVQSEQMLQAQWGWAYEYEVRVCPQSTLTFDTELSQAS